MMIETVSRSAFATPASPKPKPKSSSSFVARRRLWRHSQFQNAKTARRNVCDATRRDATRQKMYQCISVSNDTTKNTTSRRLTSVKSRARRRADQSQHLTVPTRALFSDDPRFVGRTVRSDFGRGDFGRVTSETIGLAEGFPIVAHYIFVAGVSSSNPVANERTPATHRRRRPHG